MKHKGGLGIAFEGVEVSFVYSFFHLTSHFDEIIEAISQQPYDGRNSYIQNGDKTPAPVEGEKTQYYWRSSVPPENKGLSPLFSYTSDEDGDAIYCTFEEKAQIEIVNGLSQEDFGKSPSLADLRLRLPGYKVSIRYNRNGMGTVTIGLQFDATSKKSISNYFPMGWKKRQLEMYKSLGATPFIFTLSALARSEHIGLSDANVPTSLLRRADGMGADLGLDEFKTLDSLFQSILEVKFKNKLSGLFSHFHSEISDNVLREDGGGQSPYVIVYADVNEDKSYLEDPKHNAAPSWWFHDFSEDLFKYKKDQYLGDLKTKAGDKIRIWRCYKESVLLLLRLYQWREILGIDEFLSDFACSENDLKKYDGPHWRRVLVPPSLLKKSHFGYIFEDADLVWDTRYLMLFHERSTLVLNSGRYKTDFSVNEQATNTSQPGSFRTLFKQSLLGTIQGVRGQFHAGVVLNLYLDSVIEEVSSDPENTRNMDLLQRIQSLRSAYAKILRDPNAMSTDAAALNIIRRRAHAFYEIKTHYSLLRSKFEHLVNCSQVRQ